MSILPEHRFLELKASGDLPSPTGVALTVLELIQNRHATADDIANTIQADPSLAGRLINLANSTQKKGSRPAVSLSESIARIGSGVTRHVILGLSVLSKNLDGQCQKFDYESFWSYSLAMGIATEALSQHENQFPAEEAFSVGLLSHIGRLALANLYPEDYSLLLENFGQQPVNSLLSAENDQFLTNHLEMSSAMLKDWGLPPIHYDALAGMYDINQLATRNKRARLLSQYLNLATRIATLCIDDSEQDNDMFIPLIENARLFGFNKPSLETIIDEVFLQWQELSQLLEVPLKNTPDCEKLLQQIQHTPDINQVLTQQDEALRVLVIEDDADSMQLLQRCLSAAGHFVIPARNGREGLQLAMEIQPQLIITDRNVPEMGGLEICRALRKTRQGQRIYLILLTAQADEQSLVEAFESGVDDFIEKPIRQKIVQARIRGGKRLFELQQAVDNEQKEHRRLIKKIAEANRNLEKAALTDPLTSLPNRRYATDRLNQEWAASSRDNSFLSCMLIDIDKFKSVNDQFGHDIGDLVLREVSHVLRAAARTGDVVCRIGGEEFLVICSNTGSAEVKATAERLRIDVQDHPISFSGIDHVTISIGVATRHEVDRTPDDLLKASDLGVYAAKEQGRNRVCLLTHRNHQQESNPASKVRESS